ncbi:hypothetical protein Hhal_1824 [Halorhodospira halophila SL1]|uniref:Uncharacterized protein n=2 Tax=Halorhodospira halophila TaxID=1053 RepID=A1WY26_HALHL|nr:hypothetical protein Hhal_1824 [Halorhodospira halophila SL1]
MGGVTLVELLVALGVASVALLAAVQLLGSALRASATVEDLGRVADKGALLRQMLDREVSRAGEVPCGGTTPLYRGEGPADEVIAKRLDPPGLRAEEGGLTWSRYPAESQGVVTGYEALEVAAPEADIELDAPVTEAFGGLPGAVLVGGGRGLFLLEVEEVRGTKGLRLHGVGEGHELPERGVAWVPWWQVEESAEDDDARSVQVHRLRPTDDGGQDRVPTLNLGRGEQSPQPILRGVEALEMGFAECPGADDPAEGPGYPERFRSAKEVDDWLRVCAVRFTARIRAGGERGATKADQIQTVTVPIHGRLP